MPVSRRRPSGLYAGRGRLTPTPPFDFARSLAFIERFGPTEGEQIVDGGALTKALRVEGQTVTFRVRQTGSVQEPRLAFTLRSDRPLGRSVRASARHLLTRYLSVDDDLRPFYDLAHADPKFAPRTEQLHGLRHVDGIGQWSATFVMFRGLGRAGAMDMTEPTLKAARRVYGARYSDDRLRRIAEGYGRWAGYWALYLRAA